MDFFLYVIDFSCVSFSGKIVSDVKSRDSVLSQDSLETHFGCLGLGLVGWCIGLGLDVVVLSIS